MCYTEEKEGEGLCMEKSDRFWHRDPDEHRAQPPALRDPQKDSGSFDEGINLQTAPMDPLEGLPAWS